MALGTSNAMTMDGWQRPAEAAPLSAESDERLVVRARAGEEPALEELFYRYRQPVFRFVMRMVNSKDDAEDVTQDVFIRVYEHLKSFREECRFSTWILRIAANLCTDRARSRQRQTQLLQQEATDRLEWMTHPHAPDPVELAHGDQVSATVRRALNALPDHHKMMIVLRDLEERQYEEIAEMLGCTIGGAKLRVLRARRALKARLTPLLEQIGEMENVRL